jgi:hypothetical protein
MKFISPIPDSLFQFSLPFISIMCYANNPKISLFAAGNLNVFEWNRDALIPAGRRRFRNQDLFFPAFSFLVLYHSLNFFRMVHNLTDKFRICLSAEFRTEVRSISLLWKSFFNHTSFSLSKPTQILAGQRFGN